MNSSPFTPKNCLLLTHDHKRGSFISAAHSGIFAHVWWRRFIPQVDNHFHFRLEHMDMAGG